MKRAKETGPWVPHPALRGEVIPFQAPADDDLGDYAMANLLRFEVWQLRLVAEDLEAHKRHLTRCGHDREVRQVERQERAVEAVLRAKETER